MVNDSQGDVSERCQKAGEYHPQKSGQPLVEVAQREVSPLTSPTYVGKVSSALSRPLCALERCAEVCVVRTLNKAVTVRRGSRNIGPSVGATGWHQAPSCPRHTKLDNATIIIVINRHGHIPSPSGPAHLGRPRDTATVLARSSF